MAQFDSNNSKEQPPRNRNGANGGDPNFNWRGILLIVAAIAIVGIAILGRTPYGTPETISWDKFQELMATKQIKTTTPLELIVEEGKPTQWIQGEYADPNAHKNVPQFRTEVYANLQPNLTEELKEAGYRFTIKSGANFLSSPIMAFLPIILVLVMIYFFFRQQIRMAGKGAMSFGKSKAKMLARDKNRITFKEVAGVEEAKDEVEELVEFLKDPKRFQKLGGRIPKGVLLVGPPGTGKTLLARAIAGEADVPFFSISGSDFVEMFVGVGASRVRDMFEQGKKNAPCIIFIDEIDAVGRHRGQGLGGGHDEREQTLNALLVEMDGFDTQEGVIIIAATNRPDVLDPALLRPGRFDRQITVNLPDVNGREQILKVHAKRIKVAEGVDLAIIARGTPGYSGAELANVINEAALMAARRGFKAVTIKELEEARDKVRWGRERRSLAMSAKEKETTAYHESGHALLCVLLENTDPIHKVTIIPRGPTLGLMMSLPEGDQYTRRKNEMLDDMVVAMGGRVAEELVFGDVTTGASGDIRVATQTARRMVCEWGMSDKLGMVEYGAHEEHVFLGRDIGKGRDYSEATAQEIDKEVHLLCDRAYGRAKQLLSENRSSLEAIAKALLEFETLDGSQVRDLIEFGEMKNPPPHPGSEEKPRTEPPPHPNEGTTVAPEYPPGLAETITP
jgi:cell division protease FtsH